MLGNLFYCQTVEPLYHKKFFQFQFQSQRSHLINHHLTIQWSFLAIPLVQKIRQDLDHGCRIATNLLLAVGFEGWSPIQELILRDLIIIHQCYTRQQCARSPISLATKFRRNKKCNIANSLFQPHGTQPSQKLVNQFSFMYFECRKIHFQLKISSSHDEGSCQT